MKAIAALTQALSPYQGRDCLFQYGGVEMGFERQLDIPETGAGTIGSSLVTHTDSFFDTVQQALPSSLAEYPLP